MAFLDDAVLDSGLSALTGISSPVLHICSAEPTNRTEALSLSLGNKAGITIGSPGDRTGGGRKVTISAITDGEVTATDEATSWAIIDGSKLWAANDLAAPQNVTDGNTFTLPAFDIGIPDPA